jgi:hypothetical protein
MAGKYNSVGQLLAPGLGRLAADWLQKMVVWLNLKAVGSPAWAPAALGGSTSCWGRPG